MQSLVLHSQEIDTRNASAYWLMVTAYTPLSSSVTTLKALQSLNYIMALTGSWPCQDWAPRVGKPGKLSFRPQTTESVPTGTNHGACPQFDLHGDPRAPGPSHPTRGKADLLHAELAVHTASAPRALPGALSAGHRWAGAAVARATVTLSAAHARRESPADKPVECLPEGKSRLCFLRKLPLRNRRLPAVLPAVAKLGNWERVPEKHFRGSCPELVRKG